MKTRRLDSFSFKEFPQNSEKIIKKVVRIGIRTTDIPGWGPPPSHSTTGLTMIDL